MSREIEYNLPGYGFANCLLFGEAVELMDVLENRGLIEKTKNVCQLGTMRFVYPGAHHTRYEYIFTQLMLISNIVATKGVRRNVEISLSSALGEYEAFGYKISGGALLQCLAMLSNIGHMYDTFTASRILLRQLQESKESGTEFYHIYRRNLPKEAQGSFDYFLEKQNYYKLHLFNAIHLMKGIGNTPAYEKLSRLGIHIIAQLLDEKLIKNEATLRIFTLYKKVRKIAYLSVDMIYTPASFGANLNQMIYSISSAVDDLFNEDSVICQSISQLEDIIHKQIYDSARCILNSTRIEQEVYKQYSDCLSGIKNVYDIRRLIYEGEEPYASLHTKAQPRALSNLFSDSILLLSGNGKKAERKQGLQFDKRVLKNIPTSRIAFGTQPAQNFERVYSAFSLLSTEHICEDSQTVISQAIAHELYSESEKREMVKYAITSLYQPRNFFFTISVPHGALINECIFICSGCKNAAQQIRHKYNNTVITDPDQLHEILSCASVLETLSYTGLVMCFVGGIKASQYKKTEKVDELDGLIYFPNRPPKDCVAVIVEAKNYSGGGNDAQKQLEETKRFLNPSLEATIQKLDRCAFMELKIKP